MSLLARARRPEGEARSITVPGGWTEYLAWWANHTEGGNVEQALKNSASWACIDVLADAVSRTPFDAIRRQGKRRIPIEPTPQVIANPSGIVQPDVFDFQLAFSLVTDGNFFAQIVAFDGRGFPLQMESLDPTSVTERRVVGGVPRVKVDNVDHALWPHGDVWHVPGRMVRAGSPFALSPIVYAAKTIGTSLSVEDFSNQFFTGGGHPTSVAYSDQALTDAQAQDIKESVRRATQNRGTAVLGSGLKLERFQVPPGETQFIDLARFEVEQACRFWRVPPSMAYAAVSGQNVTYANATQADLNYLKHSLDGYFVRIENAKSGLLPKPQVVKANRDAILRADPETRARITDIRLKNKTVTINEARANEDQEPFADPIYDEPGIPAAPATGAPA